jgi:hypothetical protein
MRHRAAGLGSIAAMAALALATPADAKRFAIECTGTRVTTWSTDGGRESRHQLKVRDVYVIDEEAGTLQRAMFPRQEFDELCWGSLRCELMTSPGLIRYTMRGVEHEHRIDYRYEFDRKSGAAKIIQSNDSVDGRFPGKSVETLTCSPVAIPTFDTSKNKF